MIRSFFEGLVGPSGMQIVGWYMDHDLYINGVIVGLALLYILFPAQGRRVTAYLSNLYLNSPFAPDPKDRLAIERTKAMYKNKSSAKRK
ncbi:MAG TPA: hypothetical protein VFH29_05910 [Anaerolineales bacterium]|nr:hypothetical protein [Anaerolineales bacterium]